MYCARTVTTWFPEPNNGLRNFIIGTLFFKLYSLMYLSSLVMKHIFTYSDVSISRICAIGVVTTLESSMRGHFTVIKWQYGVRCRKLKWPLFFLGRQSSSYCQFTAVCGHDSKLFRTSSWTNASRKCLVPTRWYHGSHSLSFDDNFEGNVPGWLISIRGDIPCVAHLPDLTPCDFFYGDTSRQRFLNITYVYICVRVSGFL